MRGPFRCVLVLAPLQKRMLEKAGKGLGWKTAVETFDAWGTTFWPPHEFLPCLFCTLTLWSIPFTKWGVLKSILALKCSWCLWFAIHIWHFFWFLPFLDIAFWILISDFHEDVNFVTVYSTSIDLVSKRDYHVLARCRTWGLVSNINDHSQRSR